jgi:cytochrome P450
MWATIQALKSVPVPIQYAMAAIVALAIYLSIFPDQRTRNKGIKVAAGIPLLGIALNFTRDKILRTLIKIPQEYGKIALFYIFHRRAYLISDADCIREILLRRPKVFRRRKGEEYVAATLGFTNGLFSSQGASWARLRRATAPSFSSLNVKLKFPAILEQVQDFISRLRDHAKNDSTVDMKFEAFSLTIRVITVVAFGISTDDPINAPFFDAEFLTDVVKIFRFNAEYRLFPLPTMLWPYCPQVKYEKDAVEAANRMTVAARAVIEKKRKILLAGEKPSAMIDFMLIKEEAKKADALSDDDIIANVRTFYTAGSETTSVAITWVGYVLACFPEVVQKVRNEVDSVLFCNDESNITVDDLTKLPYTTATVKEVLRLYSPILASPQELVEDDKPVQLANGLVLYPGEEVWVNGEAAMRDPDVFENPMAFIPERWLCKDAAILLKMENSFFTFGGGPRICPGMHLAQSEIILALSFLAHHFDVSLACPQSEIERVMVFAATANKMPLKMSPRTKP